MLAVHYSLLCLFLLLGPSTGQLFPFTNIRHYFDRLNGISKTQERPEGNLERPYRHLEVNKTATSKVPDKKTVVVKHADPTESTTTRVRTTESIVFVTPRKPPVSEVVLSPPARTSPEKKRRRQKVVKPSTRFRQRTKYAQPQPAESTLVETFPSVGLPGGAELPLYLVPPRHPSIYEAEDRLQQEYEILKRPARVRRPPTSKRTTIHHPTNRRPPDGSRTRPAEITSSSLFSGRYLPVKNPKSERIQYQVHGENGPNSYRFGYDTGKGPNRQFRHEEKDHNGHVKGHYGFYNKSGKLQLVRYEANNEGYKTFLV